MTYTPKTRDANEPEIVKTLESVGAKVVLLEPSEPGLPDLLVGFRGDIWLLEVKNPKAKNQLSPGQLRFHRLWPGKPIAVVRSPLEALQAIGAGFARNAASDAEALFVDGKKSFEGGV